MPSSNDKGYAILGGVVALVVTIVCFAVGKDYYIDSSKNIREGKIATYNRRVTQYTDELPSINQWSGSVTTENDTFDMKTGQDKVVFKGNIDGVKNDVVSLFLYTSLTYIEEIQYTVSITDQPNSVHTVTISPSRVEKNSYQCTRDLSDIEGPKKDDPRMCSFATMSAKCKNDHGNDASYTDTSPNIRCKVGFACGDCTWISYHTESLILMEYKDGMWYFFDERNTRFHNEPNNFKITVRSINDPQIVGASITSDTYDFGLSSTQMKVAGIVFVVFGVVSFFAFWFCVYWFFGCPEIKCCSCNSNSCGSCDTHSHDFTCNNQCCCLWLCFRRTNSFGPAATTTTNMVVSQNTSNSPTAQNDLVSTIVTTDVPTIVTTDVSTIVTTDVPTIVTTDVSTIVTTDVPTIVTTDVSTIVTTDVPTIVTTDVPTIVTTDVPTNDQVPVIVTESHPVQTTYPTSSEAPYPLNPCVDAEQSEEPFRTYPDVFCYDDNSATTIETNTSVSTVPCGNYASYPLYPTDESKRSNSVRLPQWNPLCGWQWRLHSGGCITVAE
jgi:hypothetical protein